MPRTDTHSPANFDPAEYTYAGFVDMHHEEGFEDIEDERANNLPYWRDSTDRRNGCDHCGTSGQRYIALFIHEPTQQVIVVGTQCATRLSLASRADLDVRRHAEAHARRVARENALQDPRVREAVAFLEQQLDAGNHGYNGFYFDILHKFNRYGNMSERQADAVLRAKARDEEYAARRAAQPVPTTPLEEGRRELAGTVVSTKWQDNDFGGSLKMLVVLDDLNKVWGSVPAAIDPDKGDRVTFTATVERSKDDEHFGFFKRPSKARIERDPESTTRDDFGVAYNERTES